MRVLFAASIVSFCLLACNREPVPGWRITVRAAKMSKGTLNLVAADSSIEHYVSTGSFKIQSIPLVSKQGMFLLITISAEKRGGDELSLGATHATAVIDEAGQEFPAVAAGTIPLLGLDTALTASGDTTLVFDVSPAARHFKLRLLKESPLIPLPDSTIASPAPK
jgi:hypothetical protein